MSAIRDNSHTISRPTPNMTMGLKNARTYRNRVGDASAATLAFMPRLSARFPSTLLSITMSVSTRVLRGKPVITLHLFFEHITRARVLLPFARRQISYASNEAPYIPAPLYTDVEYRC